MARILMVELFLCFVAQPSWGEVTPSDVAKVITELLKGNTLAGVIDGKGEVTNEVLDALDKQLLELKAETYGPMSYAVDDYALSVGALVGEGGGIIEEIDGVLKLAEDRRLEFESLTVRDAELAELETKFVTMDLAANDAKNVLGDYLDSGGLALDELAGYPIFDTWYGMETEFCPRLSDRASEVRRIRRDLGVYRQKLNAHLKETNTALDGLRNHVRRIREFREGQQLQGVGGKNTDALLKGMSERGERIAATVDQIKADNIATREQVKRIQEAQAKAMKDAGVLQSALSLVQASLAIYGAATATQSPTQVGKIDIKVNTTIITVPQPTTPQPTPLPQVPLEPVPMGPTP